MKKVIFLLCVLCLLFSNCSSAQQNQALTKAKLIGTWKAYKIGSSEPFYFCYYPDNRTLVYDASGERWEKCYVEDNKCYYYVDDIDDITYYETPVYFDGKTYEYTTSTKGDKYHAEKISDKQIRVSIPKPEVKQNQALTKNELVGTWKTYKINMDETMYFIVYPNGKSLIYGRDWEEKQTYSIKDNLYCGYTTNLNEADYCSTITYFDGKKMKYITSTGWRYEAQKISETPIKVPYDPTIVNHQHILFRSEDCAYCHNTCRMNCIFCAGDGGTYEPVMNYSTGNSSTQYKSCTHCAGTGKSLCLHCDCGRHD